MKELSQIEKKVIDSLLSCVQTMNVTAGMFDQDKIAGAFLLSGAEIQRALDTLKIVSKQSVAARDFIKPRIEMWNPKGVPIQKQEVKKYTG